MCGIAGFVEVDADLRSETIEEQVSCLYHRGPDATGAFVRNGAVVAQNRLAIIDLVTGDPPITNEDESVGVALNGEIYNFQSLRADLTRRGHRFGTRGDTEVIAHLAEEADATELCRRLDGMFAFAVWDERRRRLILGRDRLGKKPLYYWTDGKRLVFASEIKGVLAHPAVPRRVDERAIPAYLTFGYVPTPDTFYEGVRSLPPGNALTWERDGKVTVEEYWAPPIPGVNGTASVQCSFEEAAREVRRLLTRAVERRLLADVPLGAFLSGGIDSSGVVGVMAGLVDRPVKTFTIGFDDREGHDERPFARVIAEKFKTDHTEFVVQPNAVDLVERLVWHYDQPFGDSSSVPTFLLSELTRGHVTVALCGDGGDELFAGYERFAAGVALCHYNRLPLALRRGVRRTVGVLPRKLLKRRVASMQRFTEQAEAGLPDAYISWLSYMTRPTLRRLVADPSDLDWAIRDYHSVWRESRGADVLDRLLNVNVRTYLLDDLLPKMDRMSMAHALEVRSPFLDRELVEFALRLPPSFKARGLSLKRVLKTAIADLVPPALLRRRKRGFGVPLDRWFRSDLKSYVEGMLISRESRLRDHADPEVVRDLLREHQNGRRDHGHGLWALLTLEVFLRREER